MGFSGVHFCVCLVLLVMSMLVSMVLTRVAEDGLHTLCSFSKSSAQKDKGNREELKDEGERGFVVKHLKCSYF